MPGARTPVSLRQRALTWLAQREHSRQELQHKLMRWVQAQETVFEQAAQGQSHSASEAPEPWDASATGRHTATPSRPAAPRAGDIPALLDELEAAGHLSDERMVESRIHVRAPRFGNLRIEQELHRLGVGPSDDLRCALRSTELERARGVWARKFGQPPENAAERARQARFLAGRGFTSDTVRALIKGLADEDQQD